MSQPQRLLEGEVMDDTSEIGRLRDTVTRLTQERDALREMNIELRKRVGQIDGPAGQLREKLDPFYKLLQAIMGDIDVIDPQPTNSGQADNASPAQTSQKRAVWESWKQRLTGCPAAIIDALLTHDEANTQQLATITGLHRTTIPKGIYILHKNNLIVKNGGRFSLKQL